MTRLVLSPWSVNGTEYLGPLNEVPTWSWQYGPLQCRIVEVQRTVSVPLSTSVATAPRSTGSPTLNTVPGGGAPSVRTGALFAGTTVTSAVSAAPDGSRTVSRAVSAVVPGAAYVWLTRRPVAPVPSPNSQV